MVYCLDDMSIEKLHELFFVKFKFLTGSNKDKTYLHEVFSNYLIYRFNHLSIEDKKRLINCSQFMGMVANINWKMKSSSAEPLDKKTIYITYARNLIDFFDSNYEIIRDYYSKIQHLKNYLHLINSYAYIILKVSSTESDIDRIRIVQEKIVELIDNPKIENRWIKEIQPTNYYRAKTEFYHISAKIHLYLFVLKSKIDKSLLDRAIFMMSNYHNVLSKIKNSTQHYLERVENYHFTMAMIYYKVALMMDSLRSVKIYGIKYFSSESLLKSAQKEIEYAKKADLQLIENNLNIQIDLKDFNASELEKLEDEHFFRNEITALLLTLRMQGIIESIIERDTNTICQNLPSLLDITMMGFKRTSKARADAMRYRFCILIKMLRTDKESLSDLLEMLKVASNTLREDGILEKGHNKFLLLRSLVLCVREMEYDKDEMRKLCSIYNINFEYTEFANSGVEREEKIRKLENAFYRLVIA